MNASGPVLVAFSSSAASAEALRWGVAEARRRGTTVEVLHVDDPAGRADLAPGADARDARGGQALGERVSRVLGEALDLDDEHATVSLSVRRGPLVEVLRTEAYGASVLVVGRAEGCRHEGLADELRRLVACSVVVPPKESAGPLRT